MKRAPWAPELIDAHGNDADVLSASLHDVAHANDWFGGTRSLRRSLLPFLDAPEITLLDIGTGSGETLRDLERWIEAGGRVAHTVALDSHPDVLAIARRRVPGLTLAGGDMRALPFADRSFDVVLATLVLHHLPDALQVDALRELARVARRAVLVAELERAPLHWLGARILAGTIWRGNPLTRHDGPVSVRRGYTPGELVGCAARAGLPGRVRRFFLYRLVLTLDVTDGAVPAGNR